MEDFLEVGTDDVVGSGDAVEIAVVKLVFVDFVTADQGVSWAFDLFCGDA